MSPWKYRFLLGLLLIQCLVVIALQLHVNKLQSEMAQVIQVESHLDRATKAAASILVMQNQLNCGQQKINAIFHEQISGTRPDFRPLPVTEECK